jgi:hypothetical protein
MSTASTNWKRSGLASGSKRDFMKSSLICLTRISLVKLLLASEKCVDEYQHDLKNDRTCK